MSRTLEPPDTAYAAFWLAGEASGLTPAAWIAAHLPEASTRMEEEFEPPRTLAKRIAGRIGDVCPRTAGRRLPLILW